MIRVRPTQGQHLIISKSWFDSNQFFTQYMENLKPARVYQILKVVDHFIDNEWGIASFFDIETGEIFDIQTIPELEEYFCILNAFDNFRIVEV